MITPWGSLITFEVSSAAPDDDPVWEDLSSRVIIPNGSSLEAWLGRATELDSAEPGGAQLVLNNRDSALTPGNVSSPYYPWWKQGRRFRIREIIGYLGYDLIDGYLEIPEGLVDQQAAGATDSDVKLSVSGVDILGHLQNTLPFTSTLAAHIVANAGPALKYYFPLGETASPATALVGTATLYPVLGVDRFGMNPTDPARPSFTWSAGEPAPGDDLNCVKFEPARDVTTVPAEVYYTASYALEGAINLPIMAGQVCTMVIWVNADEIYTNSDRRFFQIAFKGSIGTTFTADIGPTTTPQGLMTGISANFPDWDGGVNSSETGGTSRMYPVAYRFGFDPAVVEIWVGSNRYTDVMNVTTASAVNANFVSIGRQFRGSLAHAQIYVGAEDDWTREDFLAQQEVGLLGLDRQTTGERINTILDYAGFPAGRRRISPGVSRMQPARLAGATAQSALADAVETEQGRLIAVGGVLNFHDRRDIDNV